MDKSDLPHSSCASWDTLMRQAGYTAEEYMKAAVESIDSLFETGYAKKHPELIGVFMITAVLDYSAAALFMGLENVSCGLLGDDDEQ